MGCAEGGSMMLAGGSKLAKGRQKQSKAEEGFMRPSIGAGYAQNCLKRVTSSNQGPHICYKKLQRCLQIHDCIYFMNFNKLSQGYLQDRLSREQQI
jgi:hypothetical protein